MKKDIPHWWLLGSLLFLMMSLLVFGLRTELNLTHGELGVPLDDAWIHFQFARNISQGHGFSFNPGEPTPGSTSPLWTLLLASVGIFTNDFLVPSLILSVVFLLLSVCFAYWFVFDLTASRWASWLAASGIIFTGRLLWAGLAGMETTAFGAISLLAVWLYSRQGLRPLPVILFGFASQLRPEGHALFMLAVADSFFAIAQDDQQTVGEAVKSAFKAIIVYFLIAAPYTIFSLMTTGHPLPNTFYAKLGSENFFSWRTLRETFRLHWLDNPVSLLLLPFGLKGMWHRCRLVIFWLFGLPMFTAVIVDFVWHHGRYTMPIIPFQMAVAAVGAYWLFTTVKLKMRRFERPSMQRSILAVITVAFVIGGLWRVPHWAGMLGSNTREILEVDVALGHWLSENTPPDALIAVDDIGAIAYLSHRRIFDMNGLISPEMWPALRRPVGLPRNQMTARILSKVNPDYLVGFPLWHWDITNNTAVAQPIFRVQSSSQTIIGAQEAVIYRPQWPYLTGSVTPQVSSQAIWSEEIQLLGYDLSQADSAETLTLVLYWHSLANISDSYDIFIHLVNRAGEIKSQVDQKPVRGLAATDFWQPGDKIRDPYQLILPGDLPPDSYTLNVGLYFRETGERLPITIGGRPIGDKLTLTTIDWSGN